MFRRNIINQKSKNRFSLRKMKVGVVSVSIGLFVLLVPFTMPVNAQNNTELSNLSDASPLTTAPEGALNLPESNVVLKEENGVKYIEISLPDNVLYNSSNFLSLNVLNSGPLALFNDGAILGQNGKVVANLKNKTIDRRENLSSEDTQFLDQINAKLLEAKTTNKLNIPKEELIKAALIINKTPVIKTTTLTLTDAINDTLLDRKIKLMLARDLVPEYYSQYNYFNPYLLHIAFKGDTQGKAAGVAFTQEVDEKSPKDKMIALKYNDKVLIDGGRVDFQNMKKDRVRFTKVDSNIIETAPDLKGNVDESITNALRNNHVSVLFSQVAQVTTTVQYSPFYNATVSENMTYAPGTFGQIIKIGDDSVFRLNENSADSGEMTWSYDKVVSRSTFLENEQFPNQGIEESINKENVDVKWRYTIDRANNTITFVNHDPITIVKGQTSVATFFYDTLFNAGALGKNALLQLKDNIDMYADLSDPDKPKLKANITATIIDTTPEHANLVKESKTLNTVSAVYRDSASGRNKKVTIIAKYQDEQGNALLQDMVLVNEGIFSADYHAKPVDIANYEYKGLAQHSRPAQGKAGFENGEVIFVYTPKVTTETSPILFETQYVSDYNLDMGQTVVETEGVNGVKIIETNAVTKVKKEKITNPVTKVVRVGTKPTETTQSIDFTTIYRADDTLDYMQQVVETEGQAGKEITTVTYTLDETTGKVTANPSVVQTTQPVAKVVRVGTKPTETTQSIDFTTIYRADDTLDYTQQVVETEGQAGKEITTVTYTLDETTGKVTANPPVVQTTQPVAKVVRVGTKLRFKREDIPKKIIAANVKKEAVLPKTGDEHNITTVLGAFILSTGAVVFINRRKKEQ